MSDKNKLIEARKNLLEIERARKLSELEKEYETNGLISSGRYGRDRALLGMEYDAKIIEVENAEVDSPVLDSSPIEPRELPQLFKRNKKEINQWRMEQLFRTTSFASYSQIAKALKFINSIKDYRPADKKQILGIKRVFNNKSKKSWGKELVATRDNLRSGLDLMPTK